jgi:AraC-like DNA-binding protein
LAKEDIRLWRDPILGVAGTELLVGRFAKHRYRRHIRDEMAIAVFTGGAMRLQIGRHCGVALPGNVLVIPAGEMFAGEAASEEGWSARVFYPDVPTLMDMAPELSASPPARATESATAPLYDDLALARRLATLHRSIELNDANPLARQQAFAAAMSAVLQHCTRPAGWPRCIRPDNKAIRRAITCVHARFADPGLNVGELAAAAGYSQYHFMRSFVATVGVTAHDYVVQCRLHAARGMLAGGLAAAEVASAVGFADQSHLIRQFRSALGVTPGQFAEQSRKRAASRPTAAGVRPQSES